MMNFVTEAVAQEAEVLYFLEKKRNSLNFTRRSFP